ncbi:uncharacterized protein K441DRAFT_357748 [Cenococcum geophilum 1.58]|uniref:Uncharacterized protein n=1 Tax=Cenococcum geophilum 1.58 TaxID=794803 RepID=A0ACC8EMD8_9PEZI|nr:hypothetical protein K441DRAFT_357748 [Cenococcum geophilum 1.58]
MLCLRDRQACSCGRWNASVLVYLLVFGPQPQRFRKFLGLPLLALSLPVHFDAIFEIRELPKCPAVNAQSAPACLLSLAALKCLKISQGRKFHYKSKWIEE